MATACRSRARRGSGTSHGCGGQLARARARRLQRPKRSRGRLLLSRNTDTMTSHACACNDVYEPRLFGWMRKERTTVTAAHCACTVCTKRGRCISPADMHRPPKHICHQCRLGPPMLKGPTRCVSQRNAIKHDNLCCLTLQGNMGTQTSTRAEGWQRNVPDELANGCSTSHKTACPRNTAHGSKTKWPRGHPLTILCAHEWGQTSTTEQPPQESLAERFHRPPDAAESRSRGRRHECRDGISRMRCCECGKFRAQRNAAEEVRILTCNEAQCVGRRRAQLHRRSNKNPRSTPHTCSCLDSPDAPRLMPNAGSAS